MPTECEEFFFNRQLIVGSDEKHTVGEERFYALGQTEAADCSSWYLLFAVASSALSRPWDMSRKERRVYRSS